MSLWGNLQFETALLAEWFQQILHTELTKEHIWQNVVQLKFKLRDTDLMVVYTRYCILKMSWDVERHRNNISIIRNLYMKKKGICRWIASYVKPTSHSCSTSVWDICNVFYEMPSLKSSIMLCKETGCIELFLLKMNKCICFHFSICMPKSSYVFPLCSGF